MFHAQSAEGTRPCVVLSCLGASEGDMNLVRSLGLAGVPVIVVAEYDDPPSRLSRYCQEFVRVPCFAQQPQALLQALRELARRHGGPLPVLPSADPDLEVMVLLLGQGAEDCILSTMPDPALVTQLMDKQAFDRLAVERQLPVPRSFAPQTPQQAREVAGQLRYPAIVKPATPVSWWQQAALPLEVRRAKAVRVDTPDELMALCTPLLSQQAASLVQEFIEGPDEEHFDVHAFIGRDGQVQAVFSGRKWRIWPPHAGSGCFVESLNEPRLEALALDILARLGYRGIANMNFKRDSRTGEFLLLEINPRVSQWGILTTRCGVNLPWLAWRDALGLPAPEQRPQARAGRWYVNGLNDWRAMRQYRAEGLWSRAQHLRSLLHWPLVCQMLTWQDPRPVLVLTARWIARKMRPRQLPQGQPVEEFQEKTPS
ncbi:MAG: D-aspartate ligase [Pseudomonadota bacterium]|nr:D-aspartate ligase [Pseudomonadota bacterium]